MGQIGSYIRRKEDTNEETRQRVARPKKANPLSSIGIHDLLSSRIPEAFLVHETKSNLFIDEDGDIANEFFIEESEGSHRFLRPYNQESNPSESRTIPHSKAFQLHYLLSWFKSSN
ncbi:hypothetical protein PENTCL1PPCAC_17891, partial [Pristionchus entomophagus]